MPSFDVVSTVNMQEVMNAVEQVRREIGQRYDFKGSKVSVTLEGEEVHLVADDNMKLKSVQELLKQKFAKRSVSLKSVVFEESVPAGGDVLKQTVKIRQGLKDEELKRLTKIIKGLSVKVQSQIQADQLRVTGKKRDDLQVVITELKNGVQDLDLQFINFRE